MEVVLYKMTWNAFNYLLLGVHMRWAGGNTLERIRIQNERVQWCGRDRFLKV